MLEVTKVNTYGLVFHWKGSDASLKPLLLAAHQGEYSFTQVSSEEPEFRFETSSLYTLIHLTNGFTHLIPAIGMVSLWFYFFRIPVV
jgi:hypothetical protein